MARNVTHRPFNSLPRVNVPHPSTPAEEPKQYVSCIACDGTKKVKADYSRDMVPCKTCGGTGKLEVGPRKP